MATRANSTWALTPCPQVHAQGGTLTISAPKYPNATLNIVLSFGCDSCTFLFTPAQGYKLDASGYSSIGYTVPAGAANSIVPISGMINIGAAPHSASTPHPCNKRAADNQRAASFVYMDDTLLESRMALSSDTLTPPPQSPTLMASSICSLSARGAVCVGRDT